MSARDIGGVNIVEHHCPRSWPRNAINVAGQSTIHDGRRCPAGSLSGDALSMISTGAAVVEKHHWIEFAGGHTLVTAAVDEPAADWLEESLK
jgi:hypothetical protein